MPSGRAWAQFLSEGVVRISHSADGAAAFAPDRPWLAEVLLPQPPAETEPSLQVIVRDGNVAVCDRSGRVIVSEAQAPQTDLQWRRPSVVVDIAATAIRAGIDRSDDGVSLAFRIKPGEGFYGWGEWFNAFRRERGRVHLHSRDAIALLQPRETYSPIPIFLSSRGYALWLLNSHETIWAIQPERGVLEVTAAGPGADYIVINGPTFRDILRRYTALTGRPPLLPRWALGLMVTGYPQEQQTVMQARVREHRQRDIPLDALILDYHWEERYHNFRWRRSLFPDPDGLINELKAQGVRLGLIFTPFLNNRNRPGQRRLLQALANNLPVGNERDDERALPEYEAASAAGYFAHPSTKWWFGSGGMFDFANPAAAAWWNNLMRPLYEQGVAFFKNDDGEYVPRDAHSALGMDGREYHNAYGFFYGRAIYEGMEALDDRRGFVYARSVWAGSQRYPALFLGDQKPTFDHIRSTLRAGLNLGLLGFAHWTADVFGLDGKTTPELHRRYAQWALLAPVARYFWRPPAIDDTRLPWSHGPDNEANFQFHAKLRYRLLPYYHLLGWTAHLTGLPVMRPMLLEFPDDPRLAGESEQVMLGDSLLLAPVLEPEDPATGIARRRILLPVGTDWHDFWSTATYRGGGEISYDAPRDRVPLLVRGGSIVPMGPAMPFVPDTHHFDSLELHCYPPFPAKLDFYDDDGLTRGYQRGAFSKTHIEVAGNYDRSVVFTIGAAKGSFVQQPAQQQMSIQLHRSPAPKVIRLAGAEDAPAWSYESSAQVLTIPVLRQVAHALTLTVEF
jgi:alpha-glucosidase (family GH31 glycosyl hydrolase)